MSTILSKWEKIVRGLTILGKYPGMGVDCMDDMLWAGPPDPLVVFNADVDELESLGWVRQSDDTSWYIYV